MAGPNRRPNREACSGTTFVEVNDDTPELERRFTIWFHVEEPRWTEAAKSRLHGYGHLVDFAIELGQQKCARQFERPDSKLAVWWQRATEGDNKALNALRGYVNRIVQNAASDLRRKERTPGAHSDPRETITLEQYRGSSPDESRPLTGSGWVGSDDEGMSRSRSVRFVDETADIEDHGHVSSSELAEALPAVAHWSDRVSTIEALLVVFGIGVELFDDKNQRFLGSHTSGADFLAAFHVRLASTGHRNSAEWRQVVDALAAGEGLRDIKARLAPQGSEQTWWGNVRRTLRSRFERWRNDWLAANDEDAS